MDLAGFPKDRYYLYKSVWTKEPMVHVLPHWNWKGREGQGIPVMAYTNADEVELFLNGKSLGRKKRFSEPVDLPVGTNVSDDLKFASRYRLLWTRALCAGHAARGGLSGRQDRWPPTRCGRPGLRRASRLVPDRSRIAR